MYITLHYIVKLHFVLFCYIPYIMLSYIMF